MIGKVGLVMNRKNKDAGRCAAQAVDFLKKYDITPFFPQEEETAQNADLILSFGGDGTLLIAAHYAMQYDALLMGINLGTVGFLTEAEPVFLERALRAIIDGAYLTDTRSLLHVKNPNTGNDWYALNDAVITRGGYARLIRVDAFVNQKEYGVFTADGIIVATPTGSTGYSLSAGGPIVEPGMNCMIITPVCSHSMQHCPCIVSDASDIRLLLSRNREQTAELQIDGRSMGKLHTGDEIQVSGTKKNVKLIRLEPYDFFHLVRLKLSEWGS